VVVFGIETGTFCVCETEMYNNLNFVTKEYDILMRTYQGGLKMTFIQAHEELRSLEEVTAVLYIDSLPCAILVCYLCYMH
jgi:hypothetical protein